MGSIVVRAILIFNIVSDWVQKVSWRNIWLIHEMEIRNGGGTWSLKKQNSENVIKIYWSFYYKVRKKNVQKKFIEKNSVITPWNFPPPPQNMYETYLVSCLKNSFFCTQFWTRIYTYSWPTYRLFKCTNNCWKFLFHH